MTKGELPDHGFNREIIAPGMDDVFPNGAVGIRVDEFWAVAALPYEFVNLGIEQLVTVLWPDIENPTFNPDNDGN